MNFENLPIENLEVNETIEFSQSEIKTDIKHYFNNDIILIKSATGTGKTKNMASHCKQLLDHCKGCNFLSIVNLISLSREQIKTFRDYDVILNDYQTCQINTFENGNGVICINSLDKINSLSKDYIKNTILYIDEINSMLKSITHNDTITKINSVYDTLMKLIKNCKKIIFSDATINQNVLNLLLYRQNNKRTILLNNTLKRYSGIKAIQYNNENEFYDTLSEHIKNKKYFLFGCDQCKQITSMFMKLKADNKDQENDFILITSDTKIKIKNANEQFKNKYVFYSPSIITGVSFVFKELKQPQFLYITNNPLIDPIDIFQMGSRTRNIKELNYYCSNITPQTLGYESLEDLEKQYKNFISINERLLSLSKSINEDDERTIVSNTFFKIFCYGEHIQRIFKTGFLTHFHNILKANGYTMEEKGEEQKQNKITKSEFNDLYNQTQEKELELFKQIYYDRTEDEKIINELPELKNDILTKRVQLLKLYDVEDYETYKNYIRDDYALGGYFNFQKLFRSDEFLTNKIKENYENNQQIKNISNVYSKMRLLLEFEKHFNIKRLDIEMNNLKLDEKFPKDVMEYIKTIFRFKNNITNNKYKIQQYYVKMLENITDGMPLFIKQKKQINNVRQYEYTLNKEYITMLIKLVLLQTPSLDKYNKDLIFEITKLKPIKKTEIKITDDDELYAEYLFNKRTFKQV